MTTVYLAFSYDTTNPKVAERSRYLGAFKTKEDVISHMNSTSSGNQPFVGQALLDLNKVCEFAVAICHDFDPIIIYVLEALFYSRTKAIYVKINEETGFITSDNIKISDATFTIPITKCPMCGTRCVAADDDGHCSYECASGG